MFKSCKCGNLPLKVSLAIGTCLLFLVGFSPLGYAANWYVDNAATGSNKGTSWANAWTTFDNIKWGTGGVKAGDTLFISGGSTSKTYFSSLTIRADGTPTARITIKAGQESGHNGMVVFHGRNTAFTAIDFGGKSYVTISGKYQGQRHLKIMDCGATAISGDLLINDIVEYVEIESCKDGIDMIASSGTIIRYCYIHGIYNDHAIQVIGSPGIWDDIFIHDNTIELNYLNVNPWTGPDGIQATSGCTIYKNHIYNRPGTVISQQHQDGIQVMGQYHKIHSNRIENCINSQIEINTWAVTGGYVHCYNNVLVLTDPDVGVKRGIEFGFFNDDPQAITEWRVYNNTFVDFYGLAAIAANLQTASVYDCDIKNNIFYNCGQPGQSVVLIDGSFTPGADLTFDYNLINPGPRGGSFVSLAGQAYNQTHGSSGAPAFVKYTQTTAGNDFHLSASDTAAKGRALPLPTFFTTDKDGKDRGALWDIGAYAYKAINKPNPPSNVRITN